MQVNIVDVGDGQHLFLYKTQATGEGGEVTFEYEGVYLHRGTYLVIQSFNYSKWGLSISDNGTLPVEVVNELQKLPLQ